MKWTQQTLSWPCRCSWSQVIIIILTGTLLLWIMKNFNRCNSHSHHGSKRLKLAQHAHSHGSHAFTRTLISTQLQPCGAQRQLSYYFSVHAQCISVSVIHQTDMDYRVFVRTWAFLWMCVHTGVGHTDSESEIWSLLPSGALLVQINTLFSKVQSLADRI